MQSDRYWEHRNELRRIARSHTNEAESLYHNEIQECINSSTIWQRGEKEDVVNNVHYLPYGNVGGNVNTLRFTVNSNTFNVIRNTKFVGRTAVLNFASFKNPGGMFIEGSSAHEESLCHWSFLYNVLSSENLKSYYDWNRKNKNKALYHSRAIYSPSVLFYDDKGFKKEIDVITCAAPNKNAFLKYHRGNVDEVLDDRIRFVIDVAEANNVETLILGAYGCGVFGNSSRTVARLFLKHLDTSKSVKCTVYAIPKTRNGNYHNFKQILGTKTE